MTPDVSKLQRIGTSDNADFFEFDVQVLVVVPREGSRDTAETAAESIRIQIDHLRSRGRRAGTVILMDPVAEQDSKARAVYREAPDPAYQLCFALVGGTLFGRAVGSFFIGLSKPKVPTRMFATFDEAVAWVRHMVAQP